MLRLNSENNAHPRHANGTATLAGLTALIAAGETEQASATADAVESEQPDSVNACILTAAAALAAGDHAKALRRYRRLQSLAPDNYDSYYNQALILHERGESATAVRILRAGTHAAPNAAEHWADCGVLYESIGKIGRAIVCFRRAQHINPSHANATDALERLCGRTPTVASAPQLYQFRPEQPLTTVPAGAIPAGKKILIVARHQMFVAPLIQLLRQKNDVVVLNGDSPDRLTSSLQWADVAWFDWCDDLLVHASRIAPPGKLIARLHSYEVFTEYPSQVDWSKIAALVFVNQSVRELFLQQVRHPVRTELIANGLNLNAFPFRPDRVQAKKIASVGYINYKKNPALLLHCFKAIHEYDPGYSLHIAGEHQDPRLALYMSHFLRQHPLPVTFDGWVQDMPAWYADKSFVISTSLFESFHFSVAEGMGMGLLPLIHNWYGAANLYPSSLLFSDPADCVRLLKELEKSDRAQLMAAGRSHVEKHFDEQRMLQAMCGLISQVSATESNRGAYVTAAR